MGFWKTVKEEIAIIRERDPAIHSNMEVFLYPSFRVMLSYRRAHRLYKKGHYFGRGGFPSVQPEKAELKFIRARRLERACLSITEVV